MDKVKHLHTCWKWACIGDGLISIPSCIFSSQYIRKISTCESDFNIVHQMIFFTAYHHWLCVYHQITNGLFSLHNELKWLHSHKHYWHTAPLMRTISTCLRICYWEMSWLRWGKTAVKMHMCHWWYIPDNNM